MGSVYNGNIKLSLFGESHGAAIGVVIDGIPSGVNIDYDFIEKEMDRRRAKNSSISTSRKEADIPNILSGILENKTTGAPIAAMIENSNTRSKDYSSLRETPRPSHSDYTASIRYAEHNDVNGGGHFSGRLTAALVFAGAVIKLALKQRHGVVIASHIKQIHDIKDNLPRDISNTSYGEFVANYTKTMPVFDNKALEQMLASIDEARNDHDSVGGIVSAIAFNMPCGFGDPYFDSIESKIAGAMFAIPAVKGVEFGLGFDFASKKASECNDNLYFDEDSQSIKTKPNYNGGINGGISNGMPIVVNVAFKPTPSIAKEQLTLNVKTKQMESLAIHGRHDPCIVSRAPVVVESMTALALLDTCIAMKGVL